MKLESRVSATVFWPEDNPAESIFAPSTFESHIPG
jgi:hypothetical protein